MTSVVVLNEGSVFPEMVGGGSHLLSILPTSECQYPLISNTLRKGSMNQVYYNCCDTFSCRFLEEKLTSARQVAGGPIAVCNASYVPSKDVLKHITHTGITKVS